MLTVKLFFIVEVVGLERGLYYSMNLISSNKIMCLQSVLEGKGVYLKKVNELVKPVSKGFQIFMANTKGKGSEDGRFIGTNVLNESIP